MERYRNILRVAVSESPFRQSLQYPFCIDGRVVATDSYIIVAINEPHFESVPAEYSANKVPENVATVASELLAKLDEPNRYIKFSTKELIQQLKRIDDIQTDTPNNVRKCEECNGTGEVEWEYKFYTEDFECPVCQGEGKIKRNCVYTEEDKCSKCDLSTRCDCKDVYMVGHFARFGDTIYTLESLDRLSRIAQYANADNIHHTVSADNDKNWYAVNDAYVLLLRATSPEERELLFEIGGEDEKC